MRDEGRILRRRALGVGLALWALFAFSILQVAECVVAVSAGSHGAVHDKAEQAHNEQVYSEHAHGESVYSESEGIGPAGQQCHHNAGHQHQGAAEKVYASPRRVVDQVAAGPVGVGAADSSVACALLLLGLWRRGPPSSVSRSFLLGRNYILDSTCVSRT